MSDDLLIVFCRDGEPSSAPFEATLQAFSPVAESLGDGMWSLEYDDLNSSELYLEPDDEGRIDHIGIGRPCGHDDFHAALYRALAGQPSCLVGPNLNGPVVADSAFEAHLAPDVAELGPVTVVGSASELAEVMRTG